MNFSELLTKISEHNAENHITRQFEDKKPLQCCITFSQESFTKEYPVESRTYRFRSDNKRFLPNMIGSSIFAESIDGTDKGVRLDWYLYGEGAWKIENCYIEE